MDDDMDGARERLVARVVDGLVDGRVDGCVAGYVLGLVECLTGERLDGD